eukprot:PhF_6_TR10238/c0_g1_i3/m.15870
MPSREFRGANKADCESQFNRWKRPYHLLYNIKFNTHTNTLYVVYYIDPKECIAYYDNSLVSTYRNVLLVLSMVLIGLGFYGPEVAEGLIPFGVAFGVVWVFVTYFTSGLIKRSSARSKNKKDDGEVDEKTADEKDNDNPHLNQYD